MPAIKLAAVGNRFDSHIVTDSLIPRAAMLREAASDIAFNQSAHCF